MLNTVRNLPPRNARHEAPRALPGEQKSAAFMLLLAVWVVVLYEPHWLLARYGLTPVLKIRVLLTYALIATVIIGLTSVKAWSQRVRWHIPLLAFISVGIVNLPFTGNRGMATEWLKEWLLAWAVIVSITVLVDSTRRAERLLLFYALAWLWYGLWGARTGDVRWHHVLENPDGFGAFMVIGLGFTSFMMLAFPKGMIRKVILLTAGVCVIGVVASFARGAFLAAILIFVMVWIRSPRKGMTLGAGVAGALVIVTAAAVLHGDKFWAEMHSAFEQGAEEGTGEDRVEMWKAATKVFMQRPVIGTGPNNWGVFAADHFKPGDVGGRYANNPRTLYDRSLHSFYFQTLSELGLMGCIFLLWILIDFWKRNAALRKPEAGLRWRELGGRIDIRYAALALEMAMVGFLAIAALYSTAGKHWFFTIQGLNLLLHTRTVGTPRVLQRVVTASRALRGAPRAVGRTTRR